jgi:hypothetical protein
MFFFSVPLSKREKKFVFYGITIMLLIFSLFMIIFFLKLYLDGFGYKSPEYHRIFWNSKEDLIFFRPIGIRWPLYSYLLAICAAYKICQSKRYKIFVWIPVYVIGLAGGLFGGSRSYLLGYVISLCCIVLLPKIFQNKKRFLYLCSIFLITNCVLMYLIGGNSVNAISRTLNTISRTRDEIKSMKIENISSVNSSKDGGTSITNNINEPINFSKVEVATTINNTSKPANRDKKIEKIFRAIDAGRQLLWYESIRQIMSSPFIGTGFMFPPGSTGKIKMYDTHNFYLSMFMGTGILGGILFLYITFIGIFDAIITIRCTPEFGWLAAIFIGQVVICFFGLHFWEAYLFWFPLIALRANVQQYKTKKYIIVEETRKGECK